MTEYHSPDSDDDRVLVEPVLDDGGHATFLVERGWISPWAYCTAEV